MEIELNPSRVTGSPVRPPTPQSRPAAPPETMPPGNAQALKTALNQLPPSRPDQVDRARALVSDAAYPTDEVLNAVAGLLARNLS